MDSARHDRAGRGKEPDARPPRAIRAPGATAIVAGSMLGVGIFLSPPLVAELVGTPAMFLSLWLLGGAVALCGAVAYAELGAMMPRAGGDYVFLRRALGERVAFAAGWLLLLGVFCGSIASMASALCQYQAATILGALGRGELLERRLLGVRGADLAALAVILALTLLNCARVHVSARLQVAVTALPIAVLAVLAGVALARGSFPQPAAAGAPTLAGAERAFLRLSFAYAGWNALAYVGGEVERPGRNLPLGILAGTGLVTLLYLLLCVAFLAVLGIDGLAGVPEAGTATARELFGAQAEVAMAALVLVAIVGSLNAAVLQGSRIAEAMALDGILPRTWARRSAGTGVPVRALWMQALAAGLLVVSGTFATLVDLVGLAMFLIGGLVVASLFVLRRREPSAPRPYRASGHPWLPAIYLATSGMLLLVRVGEGAAGLAGGTADRETLLPLAGLLLFGVLLAAGGRRRGARPHGPSST